MTICISSIPSNSLLNDPRIKNVRSEIAMVDQKTPGELSQDEINELAIRIKIRHPGEYENFQEALKEKSACITIPVELYAIARLKAKEAITERTLPSLKVEVTIPKKPHNEYIEFLIKPISVGVVAPGFFYDSYAETRYVISAYHKYYDPKAEGCGCKPDGDYVGERYYLTGHGLKDRDFEPRIAIPSGAHSDPSHARKIIKFIKKSLPKIKHNPMLTRDFKKVLLFLKHQF
jgi:hypothetical protein